jgi:hypothetical protein
MSCSSSSTPVVTPPPVVTSNFVFYLSGADTLPAASGNYAFYALAGVVTVNASGTVVGGEQDYNDANSANGGVTSSEPGGDKITGGTLTVSDSTGEGTLTLITGNAALGVSGTETLSVQFVNAKHALIMQFDGSATSSGSLDLQTLPSTLSGGYAFTISGVDSSYLPSAAGGVFSVSGSAVSGVIDQNDAGSVTTGVAFGGTLSAADAFGRGTLTITGGGNLINYYIVGPEVIRLIDVDTDRSSVGSAFGQGAGSFSNASLGSSVLSIAGNPWVSGFAALGQFSTSNTTSNPADFSGVADVSEIFKAFTAKEAVPIGGTYSIGILGPGYGSLTITPANLYSCANLGIYMTDPNLNLNDPNNTATGGGGGLALDLDEELPGTTGVLIRQTDTATIDFIGNYAVGWQDFNSFSNNCTLCEVDFIGLASVGTGNALSGTGQGSDPFITLGSTATISAMVLSGTPDADTANVGRYSMSSLNGTPNPLGWFGGTLDLDIYQASGGQLFWINWDSNSAFLGSLEQMGSLTGIPSTAGLVSQNQMEQK